MIAAAAIILLSAAVAAGLYFGRIKAVIACIAVLMIAFVAIGLYNPLSVREITVRSAKIRHSVRIALVSDLHSCRYGDGQEKLIRIVGAQNPDLICLTGDIFDDRIPDDNAERFLAGIVGISPCFYVTGNHEYAAGKDAFQSKMDILKRLGITRLSNECMKAEICGQTITVCGADDAFAYPSDAKHRFADALRGMKNELRDGAFTLLLSHKPNYFSLYAECGFDLALCGHAHGGQWEIPLLLPNGVYAPGQGLFPRYTNGRFTKGDTVMIVSRGLAKEKTIIPRLYNRPEIVMVELQPNL